MSLFMKTAVYVRRYLTKLAFDDAAIIAKAAELGIVAPLDELRMGMEVEMEHTSEGPLNGKYTAINNDIDSVMRIVGAHLSERSDYYSKLKAMEESA